MYNKNNNPQSSESEKQSFDDILLRLLVDPPQSSEDKKKLVSDIWHQLTDDPPQSSVFEGREEDFSKDFKKSELEHKRAEEDIKDIQIAREERKKYAKNAFRFMYIYIGFIVITVWVGFGLSIPSAPLAVLISTIPASMALFGWVLRGLFPTDKR